MRSWIWKLIFNYFHIYLIVSIIQFPIIIYPIPEGGFVGEAPQLKGCLAQGETKLECLAELELAMKLWIETAKANNIPLPEPDNFIERLRLAVNA